MSGEEVGPAGDAAGEVPGDDAVPAEAAGEDAIPTEAPGEDPAGLSTTDRQILALENLQWKYQGAKEMEIRRRLGLSPTHYYQRLNVLIDTRAALEHDPMLVGRLRRQREDRA